MVGGPWSGLQGACWDSDRVRMWGVCSGVVYRGSAGFAYGRPVQRWVVKRPFNNGRPGLGESLCLLELCHWTSLLESATDLAELGRTGSGAADEIQRRKTQQRLKIQPNVDPSAWRPRG